MKSKSLKNNIISFAVMLIMASAIFVFLGFNKRISFCDEIYSYTITNSGRLILQFDYNLWMSGEDFRAFLTHGAGDSYNQMTTNVLGDMVHPPLYYALFYVSSVLFGGKFSIWTGLAINAIGFLGVCILFWLILKKLFGSPVISATGTVALIFCQAMLSDAMLIRMYMLYTFFAALSAYANLLLMDKKSIRNYLLLGFATLCGFLTQYYFAFFAIAFFVAELIFEAVAKRPLNILKYFVTMVLSVAAATYIWDAWPDCVLKSAHSGAILENAFSFFSNLGKLYDGYKIMIYFMFQRAGKIFIFAVPIIIAAYLIFAKGRLSTTAAKQFVIRSFCVSIAYSGIVRILTPENLNSTRYYYAADFLLMAALIICCFGLTDECFSRFFRKTSASGGDGAADGMSASENAADGMSATEVAADGMNAPEVAVRSVVGMALIVFNLVLTLTGYGIDYYPDARGYDEGTGILSEYADIPWIIIGSDNWMVETHLTDYMIPERIILVSSILQAPEGIFEGVGEFVFAEYNPDDNEDVTRRNLLTFSDAAGMAVESEKIVEREYITYYHCNLTAVDNNIEETYAFARASVGNPWIIVNDNGFFDGTKIFDNDDCPEYIYITSDTPRQRDDKYENTERFIMVINGYDADMYPEDTGLYYAIGLTGYFYRNTYIGRIGDMLIYSCDRVVE